MLAHLAVFLFILLMTCSLALLMCWAYDNYGVEIAAGPTCPGVLEFAGHSHKKKRFPPVSTTVTHPRRGRARSVVSQRGAAQSLSPKRYPRRLRKTWIVHAPLCSDKAAPQNHQVEEE